MWFGAFAAVLLKLHDYVHKRHFRSADQLEKAREDQMLAITLHVCPVFVRSSSVERFTISGQEAQKCGVNLGACYSWRVGLSVGGIILERDPPLSLRRPR